MEEKKFPTPTCVLHEEQLQNLLNDIYQIKKTIHGNGSDGMKTRLAIVEKEVIEDMPEIKKRINKLSWLVATATGIMIVLQPVLVAFFLHMINKD